MASYLTEFVKSKNYDCTNDDYTNNGIRHAAMKQTLLNQYVIMSALKTLITTPKLSAYDHGMIDPLAEAINGTASCINDMDQRGW